MGSQLKYSPLDMRHLRWLPWLGWLSRLGWLCGLRRLGWLCRQSRTWWLCRECWINWGRCRWIWQLVVGVLVEDVLDGGDVAAPQIKDPPHFGKNQILFFSQIIFFDHLGEYEAVHFLSAQS